MLAAVSPLSSDNDEMQQNQLEMCFQNYGGGGGEEEFLDFSGGNLLDSIDFDDFFVGINDEEDVLPDLEMDPEILAEFSVNINGGDDSQTTTTSVSMEILEENIRSSNEEDADKGNMSSEFSSDSTNFTQGDLQQDVMSKRDEQSNLASKSAAKKGVEKRKSSEQSSRHAHAKRKVKVDWTPELHKRFVQAVEQLGVDKAVPSRILELMGIDCLTRHNIASHLQKYRSHRKNLLAREAEATNWTQKRQLYCAPAGGKRVLMNPWHAPTIGFPPPMTAPAPAPAPAPTPQMIPHFRPLHVWGHPSINQSSMLHHHVWPKHLGPPAPPPLQPLTWAPNLFSHPPPTLSPSDPSFWHSQQLHRFSSPPVPGVPAAPAGRAIPQPPLDFQPSKESIDAAMGDVISKPWLPLPLGLKPPCVDGVLVELQRQGIPKIPPATVQFDDISCSNFTRLC